jgi:hypothetical protein
MGEVCDVRSFLERRRGFAGAALGGGDLLVTVASSFHCGFRSRKGVSRCARARERERNRRECAGVLYYTGIGEDRWQQYGAPAVDLSGLAAFCERVKREEREERMEIL